MPLEGIYNRIIGHLEHVKANGRNSITARCPCHDDHTNSLCVTLTDDRILINCFAGCELEDIVKALGFKMSDLFAKQDRKTDSKLRYQKTHYVYTDADGNPLARKTRYYRPNKQGKYHKAFYWEYWDGGQWLNNRSDYWKDHTKPKAILYNLPQVIKNQVIYFVEGEKDADTVNRLGFTATSLPTTNSIRKRDAQYFKGKQVIIITDNDTTGYKSGASIKRCLDDEDVNAKLIKTAMIWPDAPAKADITDYFMSKGEDATIRVLSDMKTMKGYQAETKAERKQSQDEVVNVLCELKPDDTSKYSRDDLGNSKLFATVFKNKLRYNTTAKEWFYYDGKKWVEDVGDMMAARYAKRLAQSLVGYASTIDNDDRRTSYLKFVSQLGSKTKRDTVVNDARENYHFSSSELDTNDYLLNVQNGVLDLKTFELKPHDPSLMLSRIGNVEYDPKASQEPFKRFVNQIMQGDAEKIHFLQKLVGYAMTGDTREEGCYILYGKTTRNGKSTFVETIGYMLGNEELDNDCAPGYALTMNPETLAVKNRNSANASGDIARLKWCRFLNMPEPRKGLLIDAAMLKQWTGRDTITARFMYQSEFQFKPKFKLFMNTNYLPNITDDTLFASNRISVITFDKHFTPEEQDKTLKQKLIQPKNLSGVLNWCLDGLKSYYNEGLTPPDCVKAVTEQYRFDSDKIEQFKQDCLKQSDHNSKAGEIYKIYDNWCLSNGYGTENKKNFFEMLKTKNMYVKSGTVDGKTCRNVVKNFIPIDDAWTPAD